MEIENRIEECLEELKVLFQDLSEKRKELIFPMLQNAAFMKVTLEDLQETINEKGAIEKYKNGENQYGKKASSELQAYNQLIKNYTGIMDKLNKMLPEKIPESKIEKILRGDFSECE